MKGYVYLAHDSDKRILKIGHSKGAPRERMNSLSQTSKHLFGVSNVSIVGIAAGGLAKERRLLSLARKHGTPMSSCRSIEWFHCEDELLRLMLPEFPLSLEEAEQELAGPCQRVRVPSEKWRGFKARAAVEGLTCQALLWKLIDKYMETGK